jgi:hypothetical protein
MYVPPNWEQGDPSIATRRTKEANEYRVIKKGARVQVGEWSCDESAGGDVNTCSGNIACSGQVHCNRRQTLTRAQCRNPEPGLQAFTPQCQR